MTSTYDSRGRRVGATVLKVTPNWVTQIKTEEGKDGYDAIQIGTETKKSVRKPQLGHLKKSKIEEKVQFMREVRVQRAQDLEPGEQINVSQVFSKGDAVKVSAISKGKGFQGGMRRHNFHGGPRTHGQSDRQRAPGAIGSGTTPGRVYKGKRMAGHMGSEQVSVKNLEVVKVDKKANLLVLKGAIPGATGGLVRITKIGRMKGYTPPPEEKEDEETEGEEVGSKNQESSENNTEQSLEQANPVEKTETQVTETPTEEVKADAGN